MTRWAMVIDLGRCVGCHACTVACQIGNDLPLGMFWNIVTTVGPKGTFTIREQPLRRIVEVETFVQSAGGEYFFLPSIPALAYLAAL